MTIGHWELIALQDAHFTMKASLFPDADSIMLQKMEPAKEADASCNMFLLKKEGKNILFDAGCGYSLADKMEKLNISPEAIDYVMITHLHGDHIGGLLQGDSAYFPRAEIWVSEAEWRAWTTDSLLQQNNPLVAKIQTAYQNRIQNFEFGKPVVAGITALNASGHTPGHTVFEVGNLLVFGDILHAADLQLENPFLCATYDMDKVKAINARVMFYNYASQNSKIVLGMHLPFPGIISDFSQYWE